MVKGFGRKMEKCRDFQKFGISEVDKSKKWVRIPSVLGLLRLSSIVLRNACQLPDSDVTY